MNVFGWFLVGVAVGIALALYPEPEPETVVGAATVTDEDGRINVLWANSWPGGVS